MSNPEVIAVKLTSPEAVVWEGEALSLTSKNSEGIFDLYPDHARFMTLLEGVDVSLQLPNGQEEVFTIDKAVLLFQDATAKIYLHTHIEPKKEPEEE